MTIPSPEQNKTPPKKSICVFCGSSNDVDDAYFKLARGTGTEIAKQGWRLVYGGGGVGLMGETATATHDAGGDVLGIIPKFLLSKERILTTVEHRIVENMHERKSQMYDESDAFIVLPGGMGTLEEAVEIMSWMRLDLHTKPMVFLDENEYWTPLFDLISHTVEEGFSPAWALEQLYTAGTPGEALRIIEADLARDKTAEKEERARPDLSDL